jgi:4-amino-4-deoxy-L-arabinose transferase-like glycosyltransferase
VAEQAGQAPLLSRVPAPVWALGSACFIVAVSIYRLHALRLARHPGHADPAFYYNVAQNLDAGRGPRIDYIWEFLNGQPDLPRYAFDYWLPLPSALMSIAIHLHPGLVSALTAGVVMSIVLAAGTYWLAKGLTRSVWVPSAAAAVVMVQPVITRYSVQAESAIYLAAFAILAMAAAVGARSRPWLWPIAGIFAGLANLSRNEGLLLIIVLVVAAAAWPARVRRGLRVVATLAGYLLAMVPLYVMNLYFAGTPMPSAFAKLPFITVYENLFALHVDQSFSALLGGSVGNFVHLRAKALVDEINVGFASTVPFDGVLIVVLLASTLLRFAPSSINAVVNAPLRPRPLAFGWWWSAVTSPWFVLAGFAASVFLFDGLVVPVVASAGAVVKVMAAILPVLVVGAMVQLGNLRFHPALALSIAAVMAVAPLVTLQIAGPIIVLNNKYGDSEAFLGQYLRQEQTCIGAPVVLMTRNPWETTPATGFRTVMIPNAPLADILDVARRYGVTDIQLNATRAASLDEAVIEAAAGSGPLVLSPSFPDRSVYRIRAAVLHATC